MDFLTRKVRDIFAIFSKETQKPEPREITKSDAYLELIFKVLSWEDVSFTLSVFLCLNFVFWLVIYLELRFLGVMFVFALIAFITDFVFENKGAVVRVKTEHLEVMDEIRNDLNDVVLSLKALRKDSPSSFCAAMGVLCVVLSVIARTMSGSVLVYLALLAIFFAPLILSKIPPQHLEIIREFVKSMSSDKGVLAEDELIPYISAKDFSQRDADLDSLLTDRTADSVTNSLISGLQSMPSHLDADFKDSSCEEDDPLALETKGVSFTPGESTDSDSENKNMRFESRHFNGDSSSEEEYSKNLNFDTRDSVEKEAVSNLINVGDNLVKMASAIRDAVSQPRVRQKRSGSSGSESDFEIINSEEIDEH